MDYEEVRRRARIGLFHTIIPLSRYIWHTNYFDTISFGLAEGGHGQQLIQLIEEYGHIDKSTFMLGINHGISYMRLFVWRRHMVMIKPICG